MAIQNRLAAATAAAAATPPPEYPRAPRTQVTGPARRTSVRVDKAVTTELGTIADDRGLSTAQLVDQILVEWIGREDRSAAQRIRADRKRLPSRRRRG